MDSIKDIIPRVIGPLSGGQIKPADIGHWWERHYGGKKQTAVVAMTGGVLTVHVDSAARRVKMEIEKKEYLKHIQEHFPAIKDLRIKVGKII